MNRLRAASAQAGGRSASVTKNTLTRSGDRRHARSRSSTSCCAGRRRSSSASRIRSRSRRSLVKFAEERPRSSQIKGGVLDGRAAAGRRREGAREAAEPRSVAARSSLGLLQAPAPQLLAHARRAGRSVARSLGAIDAIEASAQAAASGEQSSRTNEHRLRARTEEAAADGSDAEQVKDFDQEHGLPHGRGALVKELERARRRPRPRGRRSRRRCRRGGAAGGCGGAGEGRVHRRADRLRRQEDPGHQGGARAHRPRPQGGQGPRRRRAQARQGGRRQGGGRGR